MCANKTYGTKQNGHFYINTIYELDKRLHDYLADLGLMKSLK